MTFIVIAILISCLSVMAIRGQRGTWPPGMPVARPRLSAVGGTYEGSHGRPSDAYVIQERLIATASGSVSGPLGEQGGGWLGGPLGGPLGGQGGGRIGGQGGGQGGGRLGGQGRGRLGDASVAAVALGAVVAARPRYGAARKVDMDGWAQAVHRSIRTAAQCDPATSGLVSTLDLIILDATDTPCLRFAHVGDGAIWHCPKSARPQPLTTSYALDDGSPYSVEDGSPYSVEDGSWYSLDDDSPQRGLGLASALSPQVGTVSLRPGDRVVIITNGAIRALGASRMTELLAGGPSPAACLDRVFDEMAAVEPKDDATVVIADFVTT
ncbi:SpoIIE family protein phosphatase [Nonomuraea sp. NPDC049158]|uniref:SpoIIE family protein phosphatase n=1 Tax=Nonomuraea sp. NPDC049158 TaxID=3155649 RepID=UPI0033F45020